MWPFSNQVSCDAFNRLWILLYHQENTEEGMFSFLRTSFMSCLALINVPGICPEMWCTIFNCGIFKSFLAHQFFNIICPINYSVSYQGDPGVSTKIQPYAKVHRGLLKRKDPFTQGTASRHIPNFAKVNENTGYLLNSGLYSWITGGGQRKIETKLCGVYLLQ